MKVSIRTKFLIVCLSLVLVTIAGISLTYYTLTKQDKQRESRQRIQIGFDIILNDYSRRITTYTQSVKRFLAENVALLWATYTYSRDQSEDGTIRFLFDNFADASEELRQFGRVASADRVMLYGSNRRLLVVYQRIGEQEFKGGYFVSEEEGMQYLPMNDPTILAEITFRYNNRALRFRNKPFPKASLPHGVSAMYDQDIPDEISIHVFKEGAQLGIRIVAPIYRRDVKMGVLVGDVFYTQSMIEEYASLSKTDINFFAEDLLSVGTLKQQTRLDSQTLAEMMNCQDVLDAQQNLVITSLTFGIDTYYQGRCVLKNGGDAAGAITVSLSKDIEQREIGNILEAVFTISGIGILICLALVSWVVVPKFTNPILRLDYAALRMAQGDLSQPIDESGNDELSTLAQSFAHMRDEIQRKIQELEELNAELDQRVEDRTAELVRQSHILDTFLETVPDRIFFKDIEGKITRANVAYAVRVGLPNPAAAIGKTAFDLFPPDEADKRHEQDMAIIRTGIPLIGEEEERKGANGQKEWSLITKMPLRDERGEIVGTFGISRDITLLKQSEEALRQAKEAAESANSAKSEFLANMSHELRTPLNVMLGFAQIMARHSDISGENKEYLDIIRHSGEHLLSLINNVLDLSKIEAGRMSVNESTIDLFRLLSELEEMFTHKAAQKHLSVVFEQAEQTPQYVYLDAPKLRQILINLLNNAIKFTEEGGIAVRVKPVDMLDAASEQPNRRWLHFEVEDTGPGIAPEEIEALFEAFRQTQTGRQAQEGTGLGLTISQRFVHLLGGEIWVDSVVGQGTTFSFTIPVDIAQGQETVNLLSSRRIVALEPGQPRYRILVVDDKPGNRHVLVKLLSPFGFDVAEAANGQEALAVWREFKPHLVWMDIRMPVMNGYEATRQMKASVDGQATVVIALTASGFDDEQEKVLAAGCDGFLHKPFREADIFEMMQKYLGVRYVYEGFRETERAITPASFREALSPEAFAALSPELLAELRQAIVETDPLKMRQVIAMIRPEHQALADTLDTLTKEFRFDILQAVFEEIGA
ncbi:putative Histidine kinase [Candidatus Moduliflexus flocculans]|uniref:histidine kinase n=1 Tax=Candidatus Moduliflexus flocculans TaxID=1499966 RepID=A0A081BM10_9BACT|nr:putative Histidine kinase [Candidatus Moduliflexus flocculans]